MAIQIKKSVVKKSKKAAPNGVAHIQSTFNNTIVTITNTTGETISWASAGAIGFKGAKKGTPFAAQIAAEKASKEAITQGVKKAEVLVCGPGAGSPHLACGGFLQCSRCSSDLLTTLQSISK